MGCMHGSGFALAKTLEETGFERFQMYLKVNGRKFWARNSHIHCEAGLPRLYFVLSFVYAIIPDLTSKHQRGTFCYAQHMATQQ